MHTETDVPSGRPASATPTPDDPRLARLSFNQRTIRAWSVREAVEACVRYGVPSIGLWREPVKECGIEQTATLISDSGLRVSSLCRAGFFSSTDRTEWSKAIRDTERAIEETARVGAHCLPLVPGGMDEGSNDLRGARSAFAEGLDRVAPVARDHGVHLAVEPLSPMFCADRGVVSTIDQALSLVADYPAADIGVILDTYHIWWDPKVEESIAIAGERISGYQACDWVLPIREEFHASRGMMGDGYADHAMLTSAVESAGYRGDYEVEVFNTQLWAANPDDAFRTILRRYVEYVAPREADHPTNGQERAER